MIHPRLRSVARLGAFGVALFLVALGVHRSTARAQGEPPPVGPASDSPAVDDGAAARATLAELERSGTGNAAAIADATAHAKDALERATRLGRAGDEAHAKIADSLAREWAETARDLDRAARAESVVADLRHQAMVEQERVERSRALVEEGVARVGRLQAQIDAAPVGPGQGRHAVELHDGQGRSGDARKKDAKARPLSKGGPDAGSP